MLGNYALGVLDSLSLATLNHNAKLLKPLHMKCVTRVEINQMLTFRIKNGIMIVAINSVIGTQRFPTLAYKHA